ncbi:MAG: phage integrase N-terminal SAM-like domain-containing protein [Pseudomonadales bacterium]|nr:phage integrase N-terminal SAM-like domain-containing protein [Pseudomonadales bacterium]MDP7594399.1 phage integrase N-terminal SAM-like domain-containing protein [Pseudomonadales bacterium]
MPDSNKSISPLRLRMVEDMTLRKLSPKTQPGYIRSVVKLTRFLGRSPHTATAEDLRLFQLHLAETGVSGTTINATITGLKFLFEVTLDSPELLKNMSPVRIPRKLPTVLSAEEVSRFLESITNPRDKAALSVAYGSGLRASEITHLSVNDIVSGNVKLTPLGN